MVSATTTIGGTFIELKSLDSTNNYAMAMAHAGMAQHGTVVLAHEQTKGKGQRNKSWLSQKNMNLMMSLIIDPFGLAIAEGFYLSMATALGAHQFLSKYVGDEVRIKWPNDIYWRDRKAGGILIENIINSNGWKVAIVGIGMNINQTSFDEMGVRAVSLKQITGKDFLPVHLAKELCVYLAAAFDLLVKDKEAVLAAYHQHLFKKGEAVKLKKDSIMFEAVIKGVDAAGRLIISRSDIEEIFEVGELEWVF